MDARLAGGLEHLVDDGEKPRGNTTQVGDVAFAATTGYQSRQLLVPAGHESGALVGHAKEVDHGGNTVDEIGTQVAHLHAARQVVHLVGKTASQYKSFALEHAALGVEVEVVRHHVARPLIVV